MTPMAQALLAQARQQAALGETRFAVVLAHAACEWHTEESLTSLISYRGAELLGILVMSLVGGTLEDSDTRKLYGILTDDYPAGDKERGRVRATWWDDWRASRQLRHAVAHKATSITPEQAEATINSVHEYITHITAVTTKAHAVEP